MKEVVVIGGGIIGLSTAYYLQKEGHQVTVVDQSSMDFGASYVNAGYISPSHFIPLASPGVVRMAIKWMFDSSSPLYIEPRANKKFLNWFWAFNKSCTNANVAKSMESLKEFSLLSQQLFAEIRKTEHFDFHMEPKGILVLCKTEKFLEKEQKMVAKTQEQGMGGRILAEKELGELEPELNLEVAGAALYPCDWHSTPKEFMQEMVSYLQAQGVRIYKNEPIVDLKTQEGRISELIGATTNFKADEFVLASGVWSERLAKKMNVNLRLQAGKGYCIDSHWDTKIKMPAILAEHKVAVTPMNGFTRFAGTMEIAGINHNIRRERVQAIADSVTKYYPGLRLRPKELEEARCGLRPLTPDGRPYIGKTNRYTNLTIATGHGMMGWSMGPGTGKLIAEIISAKPMSMNIDAFHPDRKF